MASTTTATTATDAAAPAAFTKKTALEPEEVALHRIRITLTSVNVKNLEKGEKKTRKKIDDEEKKNSPRVPGARRQMRAAPTTLSCRGTQAPSACAGVAVPAPQQKKKKGRKINFFCSRPTVSKDLITAAKDQRLKIKGPVRLPTKHLIVPVRKSPCGNGTATWDHYEMSVHKRVIDLQSPSEVVKQITSISIEPDVDVEVTIAAKKAKKPAAAAAAAAASTTAAASATSAAPAAKPAKKEKTGVAGAKLVQGRQLPRASRLVKAKKVVKAEPKKKAAKGKAAPKKDAAAKPAAAEQKK